MTLATFLLSPNTTEKILIGVVDLLILSFYLIYFSIIIPRLGDHMPFIGRQKNLLIFLHRLINKILITLNLLSNVLQLYFYYGCHVCHASHSNDSFSKNTQYQRATLLDIRSTSWISWHSIRTESFDYYGIHKSNALITPSNIITYLHADKKRKMS